MHFRAAAAPQVGASARQLAQRLPDGWTGDGHRPQTARPVQQPSRAAERSHVRIRGGRRERVPATRQVVGDEAERLARAGQPYRWRQQLLEALGVGRRDIAARMPAGVQQVGGVPQRVQHQQHVEGGQRRPNG